jgi:hypothetical protein
MLDVQPPVIGGRDPPNLRGHADAGGAAADDRGQLGLLRGTGVVAQVALTARSELCSSVALCWTTYTFPKTAGGPVPEPAGAATQLGVSSIHSSRAEPAYVHV